MEQRIRGTNTHEEADVIIVKYMMQFCKAHAMHCLSVIELEDIMV